MLICTFVYWTTLVFLPQMRVAVLAMHQANTPVLVLKIFNTDIYTKYVDLYTGQQRHVHPRCYDCTVLYKVATPF